MHIALFGGSFDPPHTSHVMIAREVLKDLPDIDEVWFVPDNLHHWKPLVASAHDRLAMVRLLEEEKIKASDIAMQRGGKTYTIDVIRQLQEITDNTYVWICGADQLKDFHRWNDFEELEERIPFIIYPRIGYTISEKLPKSFRLMTPNNFIATDDSSTEIRERIKQGLDISQLVPKEIEKYIREKRLYE